MEKKEGVPNGTRDGGGEKKKGETVASVWFGELFRFADGLDYILMAIGTVGAFVHGCSLPLFLQPSTISSSLFLCIPIMDCFCFKLTTF